MLMIRQDGNYLYDRMASLKSGAIRALWAFSVFY